MLDYLHGAAIGETGGEPRHEVQAQAGWFNNGIGARLGANWRSATHVDTLTDDTLHFSPLATFDLRLFANFGDLPHLVVKHPWLRGSSMRFEVENIFDSTAARARRRRRAARLFRRPARSARPDDHDQLPQVVLAQPSFYLAAAAGNLEPPHSPAAQWPNFASRPHIVL